MHKASALGRALVCAAAFLAAAPAPAGDDAVRLAEPPEWPANRVDDPARAANGLLWFPRTPVGSHTPRAEHAGHEPGAAAYGAAPWNADDLIFVRVLHTPVAISPWNRYDESGLHRIEAARQSWLRDRGYILSVRTHVNPRFLPEVVGVEPVVAPPRPRAILRKPPAPSTPSPLTADASSGAHRPAVVRVRGATAAAAAR